MKITTVRLIQHDDASHSATIIRGKQERRYTPNENDRKRMGRALMTVGALEHFAVILQSTGLLSATWTVRK